MKKLIWLFLIFGLALFLRLIWLETLPGTFFVDEVLSGYLGRYLWVNGVDLYGNPRPLLYFNKFGDYYIILPMWLDGLSTFVFGVTRFATRFPTALIGALAVFPLFGIARRVFGKPMVGYLSALLLAIMPWHIVLSRATTESVIELTLILCSVWLLLKSNETKKPWGWLVGAVFASVLSYFVYHTARITMPLLWLGFTIIYYWQFKPFKKLTLALFGITLSFFLLTFAISRTDWGAGRFSQTSIFGEQSGVAPRMEELTANLGQNHILMARIFNNKIVGFGREFVNQYIVYFSPTYLFTPISWARTRYAVPELGLLYLAVIPMLAIYIFPTTRRWAINRKALLLVLWWLLVAPLPAALTVIESPNIRRSVALLAPLLILAAGGWFASFSTNWKVPIVKKVNLGLFISALLFMEAVYFGYAYTKHSDLVNALHRNDVLPEITDHIIKNYDDYDAFYVTDATDYPLYYVFRQQDFSLDLSRQFQFGLAIEKMGKVHPIREKCAGEVPNFDTIPENSLFYQPAWCQFEAKQFVYMGEIHGVNTSNKFSILKKNTTIIP